MPSASEMYSQAVSDIGARAGRYGTSRQALPGGAVLICSVTSVAGRSVKARHWRTNWHLVDAGAQYSKPVSAKRAAELLKSN